MQETAAKPLGQATLCLSDGFYVRTQESPGSYLCMMCPFVPESFCLLLSGVALIGALASSSQCCEQTCDLYCKNTNERKVVCAMGPSHDSRCIVCLP